jgi:tetratricopeptide (TPR) repeat protein
VRANRASAAEASNRGVVLYGSYQRTGDIELLRTAIAHFREAVDRASTGDPDRPKYLSNLGAALLVRFDRTGQLTDLDQAIGWLRKAVAATPAGHPRQPLHLSNLGLALRNRFGRTGQQADLDQAIVTGQQALETATADDPGRPMYLSNLGDALRIRFDRTGQHTDLDQAITRLREAVGTAPAGSPDRPMYLSNLGNALLTRFDRTGQFPDLDQAITRFREAVGTALPGDLSRPMYLSNLGNALRTRFGRTGQQADLDQAIVTGQQAVDTAPADHPGRPLYLSNLGLALRNRFDRSAQLADLDQAITRLREAVDNPFADHLDQPTMLSNLGNALLIRFDRTGHLADLDQAISRQSGAVKATPADYPDRTVRLFNLGTALRSRFERTGQQADLDQAIKAFREGAGVLTASPGHRVAAARGWGQCAMQAGNPGNAAEGYAAATELLPLAAWHGLDQATREHHLQEWAGLASDAAAAAVTAGQLARAVELLEAGRSILWKQALHLREDLAALQEQAPTLAAQLEASRLVLDTFTSVARSPDMTGDIGQLQDAGQQMLEERRQAGRDWDAAVDQVRQIEGFEHFLRPVPFATLRAAAAQGSVVIVNISRHGSHALIVTPAARPDTGPALRVVDLPAAPIATVADQANALLTAQRRSSAPDAGWQRQEDARNDVFNILAWCWQAITEPVLTALGRTYTPQGRIENWPRVWWCPTGPAAVLPLHAAGRHPRAAAQYEAMGEEAAVADTVAGRVISSYTPTLAALNQARIRPASGRVRQLAVGIPEAPGYAAGASSLPAVSSELRVLASYLPEPEHATHLPGSAATRQAVLEALPGHSWLHLSCHSFQDPADPSLSAFLLADQPLTLADLTALNLAETDLAYLAACQTATGDLRLPDEALHLAGALQLVGYRHVLATLWNISDRAAPAMADTIYAHLLRADPDRPDPADRMQAAQAPHALHHAITRLRQTRPGDPLLWAPYIHLGP